MPDSRTGIVEFPPGGSALRYRARWSDGTESAITPAQFADAEKAPARRRGSGVATRGATRPSPYPSPCLLRLLTLGPRALVKSRALLSETGLNKGAEEEEDDDGET
jgi:hypothetical protein